MIKVDGDITFDRTKLQSLIETGIMKYYNERKMYKGNSILIDCIMREIELEHLVANKEKKNG